MSDWQGIAAAVIPSIFIGLLFWFVMRAIIRADRNERRALAKIDQEDAERAAREATGDTPAQ